ncbi:MAG: lipase maturation factor family protein, partial [Candidatus Binatia bacterium]
GKAWHAYEFKYKPGDLKQAPMQVAPHQPRLDWQMWFAALGTYQNNRWFINFAIRLLQGSPEVLKLLKANPFGDLPPRYIRTTLYDYHFTDTETLKREGEWWKRERLGPYAPVFFLKEEKS